jgi:hypothetical protein
MTHYTLKEVPNVNAPDTGIEDLLDIIAIACEDVFQQVGHDLLAVTGDHSISAEDMVDAIIGIAAYDSYADENAKAALDIVLELYSPQEAFKLVAGRLKYSSYGY